MTCVVAEMVLDVLTISSRSGIGRRDTSSEGYRRFVGVVGVTIGRTDSSRKRVVGVATSLHTVRDIDPKEPANMRFLLAFESTQAAPQRFCLNDIAGHFPLRDVTVKSCRTLKHTSHSCHFGHVPLRDVAVKRCRTSEHTRHTSHT